MKAEIKERINQILQGGTPDGYEDKHGVFLPIEWTAYSMGQLMTPVQKKAKNSEYDILSITAGKGFVLQSDKFGKDIAGKQYEHYTVLEKGDFSYNKGNSKTYPQGCVYMLEDREEAAVPNVFNSFRLKSADAESHYYRHLFINGYLNHQLYRLINSGVRNDGLLNLYDDDFYDCILPAPPILEQRKIAEILSHCDKVIELKKNFVEEKRRRKKWLMQNLLNPDSGVRLPGFQGEWKEAALEEICTIVGGGTPDTQNLDYWNGDIPWISSADLTEGKIHVVNITRYITKKAVKNSATRICPQDTILIVSRVGVGKIAIAPVSLCTSQDFTNLTCVRENVYFTTMLLTQAIEQQLKYTQGTSIKGITVKEIKAVILQFPSLDEQTAIANVLSTANQEINCLEQELAQWHVKKKSLMQLLLTGIVRTNV